MTTVPASDKHYTARIIERQDLSEDLWLIRVDPGGPFSFKAGQYATLGVDYEDRRIERAYSIVSSPYEQGLEFFIELVPQGALTPHLYKLQLGDTMLCRKVAKGRLTIYVKSGRAQHLLLATVTGIAPFVSYVCTCIRTGKATAIPCPATTSSTVCKEEAAPGNSDTTKNWNALFPKCPGSTSSPPSAAPGKTLLGQARPAASMIWSESTRICGGCGRTRPPRTFVGVPACARTGKASSSAPAGRKARCSKRFISFQVKKREPSGAAYTRVDFWRERCTMRPGQIPNLNEVWFFESEGAS
jgi:hypothetical protein